MCFLIRNDITKYDFPKYRTEISHRFRFPHSIPRVSNPLLAILAMPVLSRYDADANELRPQQALWRYDETSDDQSSGSNTCGGGSEILGSKK